MTRLLLSLIAAALILPTAAGAQHPPPPPEDGSSEASPEQHEKLLKRIRLVRMYALTEALDLDEATAAKVFPFLKAQDDKIKALHADKRKHSKQLRKMIRDNNFPEKPANEHMTALGKIGVELAQAHVAQADGLKRLLSTEQRVKYVMVREKLEREIRKTIRQHRKERMGGGGGRGPKSDTGERRPRRGGH